MTGQQLKNSILQMAVQGKLVPQDPNDEPASVLLERIRAEKEKLIKEGKIKKEKNPSVIFRGADNLPYEKIGKNDPVCIAGEVPFEIPESWEWVRLGSIGDWGSGATPSRTTPEYYNGNIPWLKTGDLNDGYITHIPETITERALLETSVRLNPIGSVLIAMYGATIGKLGILQTPATTNQACCACIPFTGIYNEFLFYFLMSQKLAFIKRGEGGAQPNISKEKIVATLMPLPPKAEQKRIVEKLHILQPYIESYTLLEKEDIKLHHSFPEILKKSILQYAIQGKLVSQDPTDEPASALLERIRAEKEQLIKSGKIKRDKHESVIFRRDNSYYEKVDGIERCIDDDLPFEIPESWEWCRLGTILQKLTDGTHSTPKYTARGIPFISVKDISSGKISFERTKFISKTEHELLASRCDPHRDDILLTKVGTTGIPVLVDTDRPFSIFVSVAQLRFSTELLDKFFLIYLLKSPLVQTQCRENTKGVGNKNWVMRDIANTLICIPPLAEQKRIQASLANVLKSI
mgnify:CR=1 FL=1